MQQHTRRDVRAARAPFPAGSHPDSASPLPGLVVDLMPPFSKPKDNFYYQMSHFGFKYSLFGVCEKSRAQWKVYIRLLNYFSIIAAKYCQVVISRGPREMLVFPVSNSCF